MKKLLFTALLSMLVLGVSAQKKTLKSAQKALNKKEYDGAIELANQAAANAETKDNPQVYDILGKAYMYKYKDSQMEDLALATQSYDQFQVAIEKGDAKTQEKIMEEVILNPATGDRLSGGEGLRYLEILSISQANKQFNEGNYEVAYDFFALAAKIIESTPYEFYAGYCAQNSDKDDEAVAHFLKVVNAEEEFENANFAYNGLIDVYNRRQDWDNALKYIRAAKDLYPEEKLYGEYEIDILIQADRMTEAITQLKEAVAQGGANEKSYFNLAWLQFNNEEFDEALAAATEALKIKPDYYDALYIAGSVPFNKAVAKLKEANNETDNDKYEVKKNEAVAFFKEALPSFEKAVEIRGDDTYTLNPLSTIYDQLGMADKRDAILKKIESLEGN